MLSITALFAYYGFTMKVKSIIYTSPFNNIINNLVNFNGTHSILERILFVHLCTILKQSMIENRAFMQKFAMHFGTYMGVFWILKFALFPLGFKIPFLMILFFCLTVAVPFMGYFYVRSYRDKICHGAISFGHACVFTIFMYIFASLLASVGHYIYFAFIDNGFIIESYTNMVNQIFEINPAMENEKEMITDMLDDLRLLNPINITLQILSSDVLFCSILALPTALFVMKKPKFNNTEANEDQPA